MRSVTNSLTTKKTSRPKRYILGLVALASAAVVGTAGMAGATNNTGSTYGGGNNNNVNTNINIDASGDRNIIQVGLHYVFGIGS